MFRDFHLKIVMTMGKGEKWKISFIVFYLNYFVMWKIWWKFHFIIFDSDCTRRLHWHFVGTLCDGKLYDGSVRCFEESYKLKLIFLIFFGPNTLNFPYISEELTDKYHLRKSILACITFHIMQFLASRCTLWWIIFTEIENVKFLNKTPIALNKTFSNFHLNR
jgi:hypothetical protein